jgi:hypothetical protein
MELVLENPYAQDQARQWSEALRPLERVTVRIRSARRGDKLSLKEQGEGELKSYRVTGIITSDNRLRVPGATFTLRDRAGLTNWLATLREGGEEGLFAPRFAYGLLAKQLAATHQQLSRPIQTSTKGLTVAQAARAIAREAGVELESSAAARSAAQEKVPYELKGLSAGTALAAALRPGGLVMALASGPRQQVRLLVRDAREVEEFWPIGWPLEKPPGQAAPALFESLTVEITDFPLSEALAAVQSRVEMPMLYDHNSLLRERIDPAATKVSHPAKKASYMRVIRSLLSQARLQGELRADEAGEVFLWITTLRQPR